MTHKLLGVAALSFFGFASGAVAQTCDRLMELPLLAGDVNGEAAGITPDGRFVLGTSIAPNTRIGRALIWSSGGVNVLPYGPGMISAYGRLISDDGTAVVGECTRNNRIEYFYWTAATGSVSLGVPHVLTNGLTGMTADGSAVIGRSQINGEMRTFRWRPASGFELLGTMNSSPEGITRDGSRIYGNENGTRGYWDTAGVFHAQNDLPQYYSLNHASDDGTIWAGQQFIPGDDPWYLAGIWSVGAQPQFHWPLDESRPTDLSRDGAVASGIFRIGANNTRAIRYTPSAYEFLFPAGVVSTATGTNADGSAVVGMFTKPDSTRRGYLWTRVDLGTDYTGDGMVDFFDYDAFVQCFEAGPCPDGRDADFNRDGFVDFFDYDAFVLAFETGC